MLGTQLARLREGDPEGVAEALAAVDGFDDALVDGFSRIGSARSAALTALADAVAGGPLADAVADAAARVVAGSVDPASLTALAAARIALFGAVHDALLAAFDGAVGRERGEPDAVPAGAPAPALHGARSWLHEVAVTGWRGVGEDLVTGVEPALESLLAEPAHRRVAVLLDGLAAELRACGPLASLPVVPARRWADLWTRAVLLAHGDAATPGGTERVSGRFLPLGLDVHEHANAVQLQLHGVLDTGDAKLLVRTSVAATKVDTITGPDTRGLFEHLPRFLDTLAEHREVRLTDVALLPGGDLVWDEAACEPGKPTDPFATARIELPEARAAAVPALERHPVRIAEPVLVENHTVKRNNVLHLGGATLDVEADRAPGYGGDDPFGRGVLTSSDLFLGLLRWDNGWRIQPLGVQGTVKGARVEAHTTDWARPPADPRVAAQRARTAGAVTVLRERAGKLLRT